MPTKIRKNWMKRTPTKIKRCPGCGGDADMQERNGQIQITCFKYGCIQIIASTFDDAVKMWNEKRFAEVSR